MSRLTHHKLADMMTRSYRDVVKSLAMRGVSGTAAYVFQRPLNLLLEQKNLADRNKRQAAFDSLHGTDTGGIVRLSSFAIDNPLWVHGVRYAPTSLQAFADAIALTGITSDSYGAYNFVDVGSGKGAVLLYAAELGFKSVQGVELVRQLHDTAVSNLALHPIAQKVAKSICTEATSFDMPSAPIFVFMNYPFSSKQMMQTLLENIARCGDGPKYLVAMNFPYDPSTLPGLTLRQIKRVGSDRATYAFHVS